MFVTLSLILLLFFPSVYASRDTEGELLGFSQLPALGVSGGNPPRDIGNHFLPNNMRKLGCLGPRGSTCALTNNKILFVVFLLRTEMHFFKSVH